MRFATLAAALLVAVILSTVVAEPIQAGYKSKRTTVTASTKTTKTVKRFLIFRRVVRTQTVRR